ncbi:hypothetical protein [Rheinheimera texasensis]|uniref:hypothetical protein n=1 Tax=Rheinheimera texasensis TaxID=306205 RepID=UPI0032B2DFCE
MKRNIVFIWAVAASYPLFATFVLLGASTELIQYIWLSASLLLLLYMSPQVFERIRYLTRPALYACLLIAALVLLRLICIPFFDRSWWLQMPGIFHLAFVLCFILVGQSLHGFRLDRTPDYLYRAVHWQDFSVALKWAVGLILASAAVLLLLILQQMPGAGAAHEFSIAMLLNQLFAVLLLDVLRLRSQYDQHDQQLTHR